MPRPIYGIEELALFPTYATREAYREATGKQAPAYDAARPPKHWLDPGAAASPRRSVVYDSVIAISNDGNPLAGPDGKPQLDPLVLRRDEAATLNIYEPGIGAPPPSVPPVPTPLRALKANEELQFSFGGQAVVRDLNVPLPAETQGFTARDRDVLHAIAQKLGVRV